METSSWQVQLRKGAAELVVLASLRGGEMYGLEVLERVGGDGGVLSEGTLYPLLNRLEREGKVEARWAIEHGIKTPRKYYSLSGAGAALLSEMTLVWGEFSSFISKAIEESRHEERPPAARREIPAKTGSRIVGAIV